VKWTEHRNCPVSNCVCTSRCAAVHQNVTVQTSFVFLLHEGLQTHFLTSQLSLCSGEVTGHVCIIPKLIFRHVTPCCCV